ncbi:hypothetical protein Pcinc_040292 [Petrolisthes cinctipes]|uniref:Uncharacterized protein n=1 Tax=Petrolisthes cinctipes TaxID=88211 RepID=A0AAE1EKY9_PETCI|nr:hypothetical protein Pcinc_040292 [Petrolisthes cinctipes]
MAVKLTQQPTLAPDCTTERRFTERVLELAAPPCQPGVYEQYVEEEALRGNFTTTLFTPSSFLWRPVKRQISSHKKGTK